MRRFFRVRPVCLAIIRGQTRAKLPFVGEQIPVCSVKTGSENLLIHRNGSRL
jgi:hypothetical protein